MHGWHAGVTFTHLSTRFNPRKMSDQSAPYFSKMSEHAYHNLEDVLAHNRLLRAATDTLIARIEKAEAAVKAERAQSDQFQAQVRMLVNRELELLRMLASKGNPA